jgi:hypothetical protein
VFPSVVGSTLDEVEMAGVAVSPLGPSPVVVLLGHSVIVVLVGILRYAGHLQLLRGEHTLGLPMCPWHWDPS